MLSLFSCNQTFLNLMLLKAASCFWGSPEETNRMGQILRARWRQNFHQCASAHSSLPPVSAWMMLHFSTSSIFLQWWAVWLLSSLNYLPCPFSFLYPWILTSLIKMQPPICSPTNPRLYVAAERLKHQMTSSQTDLIDCNKLIVLWGFFPTAAMRLLSGLLLSVLCIWALVCNQETWMFINAHIQIPQGCAEQTTRCWPLTSADVFTHDSK